jgi:hypothetical protein
MADTPETSTSELASSRHRRVSSLDRRTLSQVITVLIAVTALGLAGWALLRSGSSGEGNYSDAQRAEAKTKVCSAYDLVRRGVKLNTSIPVPGGSDDVVAMLAVGANARMSAYVGGLYLLDRLDPATPKELAAQTREFAHLLTDIGAAGTAGASDADPDQAARLKAADAANTKLGELCGK